jgi:D-lactate dehydrogenase
VQLKAGNWGTETLEGFNLEGKALGIIGTGRIGQHVARIVSGLSMRVLAFDAFPNEQKAAELGFVYVPLSELLTNSDIVTLHVPATPETHHLLNAQTIAQMKSGAIVINTSRGDVIDTEALHEALLSGKIAGAGLDVLEGEHDLRNGKNSAAAQLIGLPTVTVTPHIAFDTREAKAEIVRVTLENISAYIAGHPQNTLTV